MKCASAIGGGWAKNSEAAEQIGTDADGECDTGGRLSIDDEVTVRLAACGCDYHAGNRRLDRIGAAKRSMACRSNEIIRVVIGVNAMAEPTARSTLRAFIEADVRHGHAFEPARRLRTPTDLVEHLRERE